MKREEEQAMLTSFCTLKLSGIVLACGVIGLLSTQYAEEFRLRSDFTTEEAFSRMLDNERELSYQEALYKIDRIISYSNNEISLDQISEDFLAIDSKHPVSLQILRRNYSGRNDLEREAQSIREMVNVVLVGLQKRESGE